MIRCTSINIIIDKLSCILYQERTYIVQKKVLLSVLVCHLSMLSAQDERSKTPPSSTLDYRRLGMMRTLQSSDYISPDISPLITKTQGSRRELTDPQDYVQEDGFDPELDEVFGSVRLSDQFIDLSPLTLGTTQVEVDRLSSSASLVWQQSHSRNSSAFSQEFYAMQEDLIGSATQGSLRKSVGFMNISELEKPVRKGIKRSQTPGVIENQTTLYKKAAQGEHLVVGSVSFDSQEAKTDDDVSPRSFTPVCAVEERRKVFVSRAILERNKVKFPDEFAQAETKE